MTTKKAPAPMNDEQIADLEGFGFQIEAALRSQCDPHVLERRSKHDVDPAVVLSKAARYLSLVPCKRREEFVKKYNDNTLRIETRGALGALALNAEKHWEDFRPLLRK